MKRSSRILEWVACPPPRDLPNPGIEPRDCRGDSLPSESPGKPSLSYIWLVISLGVGRVRGPSLSPNTFSIYKTARKEDSWGLGPADFSIPLLPGEGGTMSPHSRRPLHRVGIRRIESCSMASHSDCFSKGKKESFTSRP